MLFEGSLYKFSTGRINVFSLNLDSSDSMSPHIYDMREGIKTMKESFKNFSEARSMALAVNTFNSDYYPSPFKSTEEFDTSYDTGGCTALYYSIVKGAENLLEYIDKVTDINKCMPIATFFVFSDGDPCQDKASKQAAMDAIKKLNEAGVTTVFVAFGGAIDKKYGEDLGFVSTVNIDEKQKLIKFMGVEVSRSIKQQSRSMRSLGSNFFSQMTQKSQSSKYGAKTAQVLEEESWFDDI